MTGKWIVFLVVLLQCLRFCGDAHVSCSTPLIVGLYSNKILLGDIVLGFTRHCTFHVRILSSMKMKMIYDINLQKAAFFPRGDEW